MLLELLFAFTNFYLHLFARFYENVVKFYAQQKSSKGGR